MTVVHPVLVMGATGRVGGAVARLLLDRRVPVRAAVRSKERATPEGAEPVPFDLLDPRTWEPALDGVERLFAMWPPGTTPGEHLVPFIDAAKAAGVERVAFLSVAEADRLRFLPHRAVEDHLRASGLGYVLLRAGYFMQNLSTMHRDDIRCRDEIFLPVGSGRISMVDVEDVAAAAVVGLLDRDDDVAWTLTGSEALAMSEVARVLSSVLGRPIRYTRPWAVEFLVRQLRGGVSVGLALFMVAEYTHARLHLADRVGDGVKTALGRAPTSLEAFARRECAAWEPRR